MAERIAPTIGDEKNKIIRNREDTMIDIINSAPENQSGRFKKSFEIICAIAPAYISVPETFSDKGEAFVNDSPSALVPIITILFFISSGLTLCSIRSSAEIIL